VRGFFASSVIRQEKPIGLIPKCGSCGLFKTCNSPKMVVEGAGAEQVLVVGEAPGVAEDEDGRLFVGKAGQYLRQALRGLGVKVTRDAWLTNALICHPPESATPTAKQIACCRPNILRTIEENAPRVILTLGWAALASVIGPYWKSDVGPLERWVGWKIPLEKHWVIPTYHPTFLMRMQNSLLDRLFADHLEMAFDVTRMPPKFVDWSSQVELLYDEDAIRDALREMAESEWAAFDYEANCLKPEYPKARLFSCSVSNGKRTVSFLWTPAVQEMMSEFLRSDALKIASNLKMEERWSRKFIGHGAKRWGWDTMLAAHCLDNRPGICSLKFQSLVKMGVPIYNRHLEPYLESHGDGHYNRIQEISHKDLLTYGGLDSLLEYKLMRIQRKEMGYEN